MPFVRRLARVTRVVPLCVGLVSDLTTFSSRQALPSPTSAEGSPSLFGRFAGTMAWSDSSATYTDLPPENESEVIGSDNPSRPLVGRVHQAFVGPPLKLFLASAWIRSRPILRHPPFPTPHLKPFFGSSGPCRERRGLSYADAAQSPPKLDIILETSRTCRPL